MNTIAVLFQIDSVYLVEIELVDSPKEALFVTGDKDVGRLSDGLHVIETKTCLSINALIMM